ncbi:MAG TPA: hypothetical protein VMW89_20475 [Desulfatiglandales bacterium]|nr:hypothetical protein [Desulfatiglandales bacterium]
MNGLAELDPNMRPDPHGGIIDPHGNERERKTGKHELYDAYSSRPHLVSVIGALREHCYPFPSSQAFDHGLYRPSALNGALPIQGNAAEGPQEPIAEWILEQIISRNIVDGS